MGRQCLVDNPDGGVDLVLADRERRRHSEAVQHASRGADDVHRQAALEALVAHRDSESVGGFLGDGILDELHPHQQPLSSHVADLLVALLELPEPRHEILAADPGPLDQAVVVDHLEQRQPGRRRQWIGAATFDRAKGVVTFPVQVRNVSNDAIYGPISIRVVRVKQTAGQPSASLIDGSSARAKTPSLSFDGKLGSENVLGPLDLSEPIMVSIRTQAATGWDAALDVRVMGLVSR